MSEGKISVTVDAPEGLPEIKAFLSCNPKTGAEFDAVVEAVGGACAFRYYSEASAHADLPDGASLILYSPEGTYSYARPLSPAIRALKDACPR